MVKRVTPAAVAAFERRLRVHYSQPFELRINDNRSTVLSIRAMRGAPRRLSLHRMFLSSDEEIIRALSEYLRGRESEASRGALREFINSHHAAMLAEAPPPRKMRLCSRGAVYDLDAMAESVNDEYFEGKVDARITWGRQGAKRARKARRHIRFGSYDATLGLIRIHPALDSADVPRFFVRFVIFHEMLHAQLDPPPDAPGPRRVHTALFRRREAAHPDFQRAMKYESEFLSRWR